MFWTIFQGVMLPFLGTAIGAACVFFMKKKQGQIGEAFSGCLCGFAAGIMVAASVWSLLIPAMEQAGGMGRMAFFPAAAGFWAGVLFLLLLDRLIPDVRCAACKADEDAAGPKKNSHDGTGCYLA